MMNRRTLLYGLGVGVLGMPLAADAQQTERVYRIGVLGIGEPQLLRQSPREAGYVEGQNLTACHHLVFGTAGRSGAAPSATGRTPHRLMPGRSSRRRAAVYFLCRAEVLYGA